MTTNTWITIIICTLTSHCAFAQEEEPVPLKRVSIHDFFVHSGMSFGRNTNTKLSDFQALAPESALLNTDFTAYNASSGFYGITGSSVFSVMVGLQFTDKQQSTYKSNPLLRLGVSYLGGTTLSGNYYKEDRITYDTLTSSQSAQVVYLDSVNTTTYGMNYATEQIRFDASLIFRTIPEARWSLYSGIGCSGGLSFNSYTEIYTGSYSRTETRGPENGTSTYYYYAESDNFDSETFRNENNFAAAAYIPMGVDFRIGKNKEFWKQTHLFYELRPGLNITSIPELRTIMNASLQQGFGLRINWN